MGVKPETKVVGKIVKALNRKCSGFYFNVHGNHFQKKGISDILGVCRGHFIAIEVKTPDKADNTSKAQDRFLRDVRRYGGIAFVATTAEEAVQGVKRGLGKHYEDRPKSIVRVRGKTSNRS